MLDVVDIDELLEDLGRLLFERKYRAELFVVGGAALAMAGVVHRPTVDVDVLARVESGELAYERPLSDEVKQAARDIAELRGALPAEWINDVVASPPPLTLLDGALDRAVRKEYGEGALVVHLMGRLDAICLKLCAASDQWTGSRDERHLQDLVALEPQVEELELAERWCRGLEAPTSAVHRARAELLKRTFDLELEDAR